MGRGPEISKLPLQLNAELVYLRCSEYPQGLAQKGGGGVDVERQLEPVALMSPELASLPKAPSLSHEWT